MGTLTSRKSQLVADGTSPLSTDSCARITRRASGVEERSENLTAARITVEERPFQGRVRGNDISASFSPGCTRTNLLFVDPRPCHDPLIDCVKAISKRRCRSCRRSALKRHFGKTRLHDLVTSSRTFPVAARVDTQSALEKLLERPGVKLYGVHRQFTHDTLTFAHSGEENQRRDHTGRRRRISATQRRLGVFDRDLAHFPEGDVWLSDEHAREERIPLPRSAARVRQVPLSNLFSGTRRRREQDRRYRGKVISLEQPDRYTGQAGALRVHKLRVRREEVILPANTLHSIGSSGVVPTEAAAAAESEGPLFYGSGDSGLGVQHARASASHTA